MAGTRAVTAALYRSRPERTAVLEKHEVGRDRTRCRTLRRLQSERSGIARLTLRPGRRRGRVAGWRRRSPGRADRVPGGRAAPIARRFSASVESSTTAPAKATSSLRGASSPVSRSATAAAAPGQSCATRASRRPAPPEGPCRALPGTRARRRGRSGVDAGTGLDRQGDGQDDPARPDGRQRLLHQRAGLAVADREELPGRVGDEVERAPEQPPGGERGAGAHGCRRQQPWAGGVERQRLCERAPGRRRGRHPGRARGRGRVPAGRGARRP